MNDSEESSFAQILHEMNEAGRFKASVLVSAEGLPLSSASSPFDTDTIAEVWGFTTEDTIASSAAIASGIIYFGSEDGRLYALDITNGELLWDYDTGTKITSSPAVHNGVVYIASQNGTLYAIE